MQVQRLGYTYPVPFPYERHQTQPLVEVRGLPMSNNVPGAFRKPHSYGLPYLEQLVAAKGNIKMKL